MDSSSPYDSMDFDPKIPMSSPSNNTKHPNPKQPKLVPPLSTAPKPSATSHAMESSSIRASKAFDTRIHKNPSSKPQVSSNPSSSMQPPLPNFQSPVEFPALQPPVLKPISPADSSLTVIGSIPVQPAPPPTIAKASAFQPLSAHENTYTASKRPPPAAPATLRQQRQSPKSQQLPSPDVMHYAKLQIAPKNSAPTAMASSGHTVGAGTALKSSEGSMMVNAYKDLFDFKPRHRLQGIPCLSFYNVDKDNLLSKIQYIVVVNFSHNRPKYADFRLFLETKKFEKGFKVVEFDKKHVFVVFECFRDFVKLWVMRSVSIKGFQARFFCWDEHFNPFVESFNAPVWIHLPGLPLFMFNEEVVLSIGALFGKTLYIDPACLAKDKVGVLSLCVSMDVRAEKIEEFWVEFVGEGINVSRFLQRVVYGDIPHYCSSCKHLGHSTESCKMLEAVVLKEKLNGMKAMQEVTGNDRVIPTVSVFERLGVLSVSTKGKELGDSSTSQGSLLEEVEVEDVTNEENFELAKQNSATGAVEEPSLKPHNSLCGNNGEKTSGVLETRVNNLHISRRFEPLAVLDEEKTSVENGVLQKKTTDCVEEATLAEDNSVIRQDEGGNSTFHDSQVNILQNPEEMGGKFSMSRSESVLENRALQNSAADSDEEATLLEDFSLLEHDGGELPSVSERQVGKIQISEKIKAKSLVVCPENRVEIGGSLQSAADFSDTSSLGGHNSPSRDNQARIFGAPESSTKDLQNDVSLDLLAAVSDEVSNDKSGVLTVAVPISNEHNFGSGGATDLILGLTESQEDSLQTQGEKQVSNMLVNQVYSSKVVITHPVTKEVIVLSPTSQSLSASPSKSAVEGMSKNERKKSKKKKRKEAEKKGKRVVEPIVLAEPIASPPVVCKVLLENWETLDSNASKDTPFWANFHAAQKDASLFAGLDAHPYMFMLDSEDELSAGTSVTRHSRLHPTYKERKERDRSLDYLDLQPISAKGIFQEKTSLPSEPPKAAEEFVTPSRPISTSWATEVEEQDVEDAREIYTLEEMTIKIIKNLYDELPFADLEVEDILHALVPKAIPLYAMGCPKNEATIAKIVNKLVFNFTGGSPDKTPIPAVANFINSASKDRKQAFDPP